MNPNTPNKFFGIKVSKPGIRVDQASDKQLVYKNDYSTTTYYDETDPRIVLGKLPSGAYGMRVSKSGSDVTTADLSDLTFSSENSFVITLSGSYTFPSQSVASGATVWATSQVIPHNSGSIPAAQIFAPLEVGGAALPVYPPDFPTTSYTSFSNGGLIYQSNLLFMGVFFSVDATNLYLGMNYINDTGGTDTLFGATVRYYCYSYSAV